MSSRRSAGASWRAITGPITRGVHIPGGATHPVHSGYHRELRQLGCGAVLVSAAQSRKARLTDLAHWTLTRGQVGSRRLHEGLALAAAGAWSLPEAELLRLLASSTVLPAAWTNPEVRDRSGRRLTTPDAWFDDVALAIMVHSRQWHADELQWESTVEHDTDLQAARVVVIGVTPHSIHARPRWVRERIETAYVRAKESGRRADVVAVPRDPWQNGRFLPTPRATP